MGERNKGIVMAWLKREGKQIDSHTQIRLIDFHLNILIPPRSVIVITILIPLINRAGEGRTEKVTIIRTSGGFLLFPK